MPDFMVAGQPVGLAPWDQLYRFSEDDPGVTILAERHPPGSLQLPDASMPGSGYLEMALSRMIGKELVDVDQPH
jgi:hypothetical protein